MRELKDRLRILMRRDNLTRLQVSDCVDVSLVTVQKWLSGGNIKDSTAQLLAERVCVDWLWLKYGTTRVPEEVATFAVKHMSDLVLMKISPGGHSVICAAGSGVPSLLQNTNLIGSAVSDLYTSEGLIFHKAHSYKSVAGINSSINVKGLLITDSKQLLDQDVTSTMLTPFTTSDGQGYYLSQLSSES